MGLFQKKVVRKVEGSMWGHLFKVHHIDVDTLSRDIRYVEREGTRDGGIPVTLLRVFSLRHAAEKKITVSGWEIFDQYPELMLYEGYISKDQRNVSLSKKQP